MKSNPAKSIIFSLGTGLVVASALIDSSQAFACGFKVSGAMGAVRYSDVNATPNPSNILLFKNPDSPAASKVITDTLMRVLAKMGHFPEPVESSQAFAQIVSRGEWPCEEHGSHRAEIIVAALEDAELLDIDEHGPKLIPIVASAKQYNRKMRAKYPVILVPSARPSAHLPAIEKVAREIHDHESPLLVAIAQEDEARVIRSAQQSRVPVRTGGSTLDYDGHTSTALKGAGQTTAEPSDPVAAARPRVEENVAVEDAPQPTVASPSATTTAKVTSTNSSAPVAAATQVDKPRKHSAPKETIVRFSFGQSKLAKAGRSALRREVKWLRGRRTRKVRVEGHTDSSGPSSYNLALSGKRAETVARYLRRRKIRKNQIKVVPYGEEAPIAQPPTSPKNRAVVVVRVDD